MIFDIFIPIAHAAEEATNTGITGTFGIDWMKFIAQLINFAAVLFVLWKWVFTPVTKKLEERTAKIEKAMRDANTTEKEKQEFAVWKDEQMKNARVEAGSIISAAQKDAGAVKDSILIQAKEDQLKLVDQSRKQIESEKTAAMQSAKSELADLITNATEKILRQKLDGAKDKQLICESLSNLK